MRICACTYASTYVPVWYLCLDTWLCNLHAYCDINIKHSQVVKLQVILHTSIEVYTTRWQNAMLTVNQPWLQYSAARLKQTYESASSLVLVPYSARLVYMPFITHSSIFLSGIQYNFHIGHNIPKAPFKLTHKIWKVHPFIQK